MIGLYGVGNEEVYSRHHVTPFLQLAFDGIDVDNLEVKPAESADARIRHLSPVVASRCVVDFVIEHIAYRSCRRHKKYGRTRHRVLVVVVVHAPRIAHEERMGKAVHQRAVLVAELLQGGINVFRNDGLDLILGLSFPFFLVLYAMECEVYVVLYMIVTVSIVAVLHFHVGQPLFFGGLVLARQTEAHVNLWRALTEYGVGIVLFQQGVHSLCLQGYGKRVADGYDVVNFLVKCSQHRVITDAVGEIFPVPLVVSYHIRAVLEQEEGACILCGVYAYGVKPVGYHAEIQRRYDWPVLSVVEHDVLRKYCFAVLYRP